MIVPEAGSVPAGSFYRRAYAKVTIPFVSTGGNKILAIETNLDNVANNAKLPYLGDQPDVTSNGENGVMEGRNLVAFDTKTFFSAINVNANDWTAGSVDIYIDSENF